MRETIFICGTEISVGDIVHPPDEPFSVQVLSVEKSGRIATIQLSDGTRVTLTEDDVVEVERRYAP